VTLRRSSANRGVFEGVVTRPAVGSYHTWLVSPTLEGRAPADDFLVIAPAGEFEHTQMDAAELKKAANDTQGVFYSMATADRLLRDLPEGRQVPIESLEPIVLWNKWPLVLLFLGLIITEWIWRKRRGLL
jgi:hypothetical protein